MNRLYWCLFPGLLPHQWRRELCTASPAHGLVMRILRGPQELPILLEVPYYNNGIICPNPTLIIMVLLSRPLYKDTVGYLSIEGAGQGSSCWLRGPRQWLVRRVYVAALTPRVQVPNNHILSKILTYITTILKPST